VLEDVGGRWERIGQVRVVIAVHRKGGSQFPQAAANCPAALSTKWVSGARLEDRVGDKKGDGEALPVIDRAFVNGANRNSTLSECKS
jgi:hypothetical protein